MRKKNSECRADIKDIETLEYYQCQAFAKQLKLL